jgi:hypothetical protein
MKGRHREGLLLSISAAARDGTPITLPGPPDDPESFRKAYGGDPLDDDTLAFVVDPIRCVEDTVQHYFQPVHCCPRRLGSPTSGDRSRQLRRDTFAVTVQVP